MTTHYAAPDSYLYAHDMPLCGKKKPGDEVSSDFKECDCMRCIETMDADKKHWHDLQIKMLIDNAGMI
jgi:hypothetical protein